MTRVPHSPHVGSVVVGDKTFSLSRLSFADELRLSDHLEAVACRMAGERYRQLTTALLPAVEPQDRDTITEWAAAKAVAEVWRARLHPDGCAFEFHLRAKAVHPEVTAEVARAIITTANVYDVAHQMSEAVKAAEKSAGN